jgi:hypothetical protein
VAILVWFVDREPFVCERGKRQTGHPPAVLNQALDRGPIKTKEVFRSRALVLVARVQLSLLIIDADLEHTARRLFISAVNGQTTFLLPEAKDVGLEGTLSRLPRGRGDPTVNALFQR